MPGALKKGSTNRGIPLQKGRTPVNLPAMLPYLSRYPRSVAAVFLANGFRIPCSLPLNGTSVPKNLKSTFKFSQVVTEKLAKEVEMGRMASPFDQPPVPLLHVSPLVVVPKKVPNKFRLIHYLSYPNGA